MLSSPPEHSSSPSGSQKRDGRVPSKKTSPSKSRKARSSAGSSASHARQITPSSFSSSSSHYRTKNDDHIPYSLKDAPAELHPAIKRKQSREHSKRSRKRKRKEEQEMVRKMQKNALRIEMLESQVQTLTEELLHQDKLAEGDSRTRDVPNSPSTKPGFYGDPF
ncbi:hypothetical protein FGB62_105g08 [Gracilaria domingensis]|nr:hypothetical protein FGB62_105g08 [Gracilaria domingensis]